MAKLKFKVKEQKGYKVITHRTPTWVKITSVIYGAYSLLTAFLLRDEIVELITKLF